MKAVTTFLLSAAISAGLGAEEFTFKGAIETGYRFVDIDGSEERYREDINLWSGPRLARVEGEGTLGRTTYVVRLSGIGGDPFPGADLTLRSERRYRLALYYRGSDYDYASPGDFHSFATFLRRSGASLDIAATSHDLISLTVDREQRSGRVRSTRGVDFDQFIAGLAGDIDTTQLRTRLAYRRSFLDSWHLEAAAAYSRSESSEALSGIPPILPLPDFLQPITTTSFLDAATRSGQDETRMPELSVRLQSSSNARLHGAVAVTAGRADIDSALHLFDAGADASQVSYYLDDAFDGSGRINYQIYDASVTATLSDRFSFSQSLRIDRRNQSAAHLEQGEYAFQPAEPVSFTGQARSESESLMTLAQGDLRAKLGQRITARFGYKLVRNRFEIIRNAASYDENTSMGIRVVGGLQYLPPGGFWEIVVERGSANDTFTPLAPRTSYKLVLRARQRLLDEHLIVSGDLRRIHNSNDVQSLSDYAAGSSYVTPAALAWRARALADSTTLGLSATYSPRTTLEVSAGYSYVTASSESDILYYFNSQQLPGRARYDETIHMADGRFFMKASRRLSLTLSAIAESATGTRPLNSQRAMADLTTLVVKDLKLVTALSYQRLHEDASYLGLPLGNYRGSSLFLGLRKEFR
ncbi:MAG: hypothetical protein HYX75_03580 [Acidobacteria bacterium]|nr:hypothetical protein [Acidobacteriota bacterium]